MANEERTLIFNEIAARRGKTTASKTIAGAVRKIGVKAVLVGDSTRQQAFSNATDGSPTAQNPLYIAVSESGGGVAEWVNGGVSGEDSGQILLRMPALVRKHFDAEIWDCGPISVNDLAVSATHPALSAEQSTENIREIVRLILEGTRGIVFLNHVQYTTSLTLASVAAGSRRDWYRAMRDTLIALRDANPERVFLVDTAAITGKADGSGMRTAATNDNTHFSYSGSDDVAVRGYKPHVAFIPRRLWEMPRLATDGRNILGPYAVPQGTNATGSNGYLESTGATAGTGPNGWQARRYTGDSTATFVPSSIASPLGYDSVAAQMVVTVGANGGGAGFAVGRSPATAAMAYDNARANSTVYTYGQRIAISSTLCGQVFAAGTSAAAAPDFSGAEVNDMITDGTVVWLVTKRPQPGDKVLISVDMSLADLTTAGGVLGAWIQLYDADGTTNTSRYLNYGADTSVGSWPTRKDTTRRLLQQTFELPRTYSMIRSLMVMPLFWAANTAVGTLQVHHVSAEIVG